MTAFECVFWPIWIALVWLDRDGMLLWNWYETLVTRGTYEDKL